MATDIFSELRDTEESMRKAKADAAALAKKLLAGAEEEGRALLAKAEKDAGQEVAQMLEEAEKEGDRIASDTASSTENKRAVTKAGVEKRLDQAVDYIVGRVVNG